MANEYHIPVLLNESIEGLNLHPGGTYVDATLGGGGHAAAILEKLDSGRLIAFDQDEDAWANAPADDRLTLVRDNFRHLARGLAEAGCDRIDGLLADLGVSSHQLDTPARGFTFRADARPDMRMSRKAGPTALEILNTYDEAALRKIFRAYGEVKPAGALARRIVKARQTQPIESVNNLMSLLTPLAPRGAENRFYARVFQALRMEVNDELEALKEMLEQAVEAIRPGGRLVVIAYHSLEDRYVKNFIRSGNAAGVLHKDLYGNVDRPFRALLRKPVTPTPEEVERNPRARSARLRIAERTT